MTGIFVDTNVLMELFFERTKKEEYKKIPKSLIN